MINSLKIQNYQSHKTSILEFDKGVNCIIGASDSGKSAIIRSLRLLVYNKPLGDSYRSHWGGDTSITTLLDNNTIERIKSDKINAYLLNKDSEFKALKGDVPNEVKDILNMSEINLQQQHDSVFLLSKNSGEVARFFNKIANLDKIDKGISNLKSWINSINSTINHKQKDLDENKSKITSFEYLEKFEAEVESLEQTESIIKNKRKNVDSLLKLILDIETNKSNIQKLSIYFEMEKDVQNLINTSSVKNILKIDIKNLNSIINELNELYANMDEYNLLIAMESNIDFLLKKTESIKQIRKEIKELKDLCCTIEEITYDISKAQTKYNKLHTQLEENTPDICPFCNNKIRNDSKKH